MATFRRKVGGKKAYRNGRDLEKKLEILGDYLQQQVPIKAEVIRNFDNLVKARGRGGLSSFTGGVSSCDFSFFLSNKTNGFQCGMIEAKNRVKKSISKSAVSEHQTAQLERLHSLGQGAFVLCGLIDETQHYFLVPIDKWLSGPKKSHNIKDLQEMGCEMTCIQLQGELVPDVLGKLGH